MVLVMLAVLGWNHPAWGPLLHEISWPIWVLLGAVAMADLVSAVQKTTEALKEA